MIVFMAIMLHKVCLECFRDTDNFESVFFLKAPAAFGLVSFLMSDGIDRKRIRRHLLIFSLSAPLAAIFTYAVLKSVR